MTGLLMTVFFDVGAADALPFRYGLERLAATPAACNVPRQRQLQPNGRFVDIAPSDCLPNAPSINAPRDGLGLRCRLERERVLQPNGRFEDRMVQRCS